MTDKSKLPEWISNILAESTDPEHAQQEGIRQELPAKTEGTPGDEPPIESPHVGEGIGKNKREATATVIHGQEPQKDMGEKPSKGQTAIDSVQMGLDAVGVADPTPITDGVNAAISMVRAFKDPKRRGEHLQNAAISAVSMVPYIGDTAKLLKVKRYGKTLNNAVEHSADAAKAKGQQRENARETVDRLIDSWRERRGIDEAGEKKKPDNDGDGPPVDPPDPAERTRSIEDERETEKGLDQQERWNDWMKQSTEKVISFTGAIGKGVLFLGGAVAGLQALNTGIVALNRDLADFNGQLAQSYAEYEADEIKRKMEKGQAIDGPMSRLLEEQSELKSTIDGFTNPIKAISIEFQAFATKMVNYTLTLVERATGAQSILENLMEYFTGKDDGSDTAWRQFFADVSDGKFDGKAPAFDGKREKILPDRDHREVFGP